MQDVPKIVMKRLQDTAGAQAHPDADLLTAFAEQSLVESERVRVMEHLARCSDCRELVALAALPASEATAVTPSVGTSLIAWFRRPVLRWGVALAGILAMASVGIVQYRQRQKSETAGSNLTARNESAANAVQPPSSPAVSELEEALPRGEQERQAQTRPNALPSRQDNSALGRIVRPSNPNLPAARATHGAVSGSAVGSGWLGSSGAGVAPKAAVSSPRDNSAAAGDLKNLTPTEAAKLSPNLSADAAVGVPSSRQTVEVESEAAPVTATAENQVPDQLIENKKEKPSRYKSSATLGVVETKNFATADASSLMLVSPRWSINADGELQRSFDGGNTWVEVNVNSAPAASGANRASTSIVQSMRQGGEEKVKTQPGPVFRAVSALGAEVWAGGSAAMLYHSADSGAHWVRVLPSSSGAVLAGDITSIEFSDAQDGKIATSVGEVWITADDGQTWNRQ